MKNKYLISIVGPTAIGKTALAIKIAQYFNTEIISSDSRQFYKEMQIGTAVPSSTELAAVTHHFIQHKSIHENYTVGDFEKEALARIDNLFEERDIIIMVGGSGLYEKAVTKGLDEFPEVDQNILDHLNKEHQLNGIKDLAHQLTKLDPEYAKKVDLDNHQRVIRALSICLSSGKKFSDFLGKKEKERNFKSVLIGLTAEREIIYERINQRVDIMLNEGLLEEVKNLKNYKSLNALNTVGYKELFEYLEGSITYDDAIQNIKKHTRRFAKRQLTWYRKDERVRWYDYKTHSTKIIDDLKDKYLL